MHLCHLGWHLSQVDSVCIGCASSAGEQGQEGCVRSLHVSSVPPDLHRTPRSLLNPFTSISHSPKNASTGHGLLLVVVTGEVGELALGSRVIRGGPHDSTEDGALQGLQRALDLGVGVVHDLILLGTEGIRGLELLGEGGSGGVRGELYHVQHVLVLFLQVLEFLQRFLVGFVEFPLFQVLEQLRVFLGDALDFLGKGLEGLLERKLFLHVLAVETHLLQVLLEKLHLLLVVDKLLLQLPELLLF